MHNFLLAVALSDWREDDVAIDMSPAFVSFDDLLMAFPSATPRNVNVNCAQFDDLKICQSNDSGNCTSRF